MKILSTLFLIKMKKNLFTLLSVVTIIIAGCTDSGGEKIDSENWVSSDGLSIEQAFDKQLDDTQYIKDLEDYISYNIALNTNGTPYKSEMSLEADFDGNSSIQGWFEFSKENVFKSNDFESIDMVFELNAKEKDSEAAPVYSSWDVTLLYQDGEMYANVHNFGVDAGEWDMTAKMYTLLVDMVKDKWVDMELDEWVIISVDKDGDEKLSYLIWTLKNVLSTQDIESSPNFLNSLAEMIEIINSKIDLWISSNELTLVSHEIEYSQLSDGSIQKEFKWMFKWKESAFDLSFTVSKKWLDVHIYNIMQNGEYNQNDNNLEWMFTLRENKKSEYSVSFQSVKNQQQTADVEWKIEYDDGIEFSAKFNIVPSQIMAWKEISWKIEWEMKKEKIGGNVEMPELSWEIVSINEILSSLY